MAMAAALPYRHQLCSFSYLSRTGHSRIVEQAQVPPFSPE
jgi:hypothetical protein